jgi:hypothetical protein
MMSDKYDAQSESQAPEPSLALRKLDKLVGTWEVSGGAQGRVTYEWMEGGFFLIQHVELDLPWHRDHRTSTAIWRGQARTSNRLLRQYGENSTTYMNGRHLTISVVRSPRITRQTKEDGNRLTGAWVYPDGGGYESTPQAK